MKCKGCKKEFINIRSHISKSFPCQNHYGVNEKLNENLISAQYVEINPTLNIDKDKLTSLRGKGTKRKKQNSGNNLPETENGSVGKKTGGIKPQQNTEETQEQSILDLTCLTSPNWLND